MEEVEAMTNNVNTEALRDCALYNKLDIHNETCICLDAYLSTTGRAGGKVNVEFNPHHHTMRGLSIEISPHLMKGYGIDVSYFTPFNS